MSSSEQIWNLYNKIQKQITEPKLFQNRGDYTRVALHGSTLTSEYLNDLLESCVGLYNQVDSVVEALKLTVPEIYEELKELINKKVVGEQSDNYRMVEFKAPEYSTHFGSVSVPLISSMPFGIKNVINLLTRAYENIEVSGAVATDSCYYTARITLGALRPALTHLLVRFNHVMMYPHRIVFDRMVLEGALRRHGMNRVVGYVQSAEEHFNQQKYVEFCAISRNALQEAVKSVCLTVDGAEHGFSNNCNRLHEIGFLRGTIIKQMKEFNGALSAGGSHPPEEEMSDDEAKFLLDSLYSFLGLVALRLSSYRKKTRPETNSMIRKQ